MIEQSTCVCSDRLYEATGYGRLPHHGQDQVCTLRICAESPSHCGQPVRLKKDQWERVTYTFATGNNQHEATIQIYTECGGTDVNAQTLYIDDFSISKMAFPWGDRGGKKVH